MQKFKDWFEEYGEGFPKGDVIPGDWFVEHNLPMIVQCRCCTMTMALPSAFIDDEGYLYCSDCKGDDEMEMDNDEWTHWNRKDDNTCCLDGCYCNYVDGCESCPVTICYCHYDDGCPNE